MLHYHVYHHTPKASLRRGLPELGLRHHFQDYERLCGVSDHVFGTATNVRAERA